MFLHNLLRTNGTLVSAIRTLKSNICFSGARHLACFFTFLFTICLFDHLPSLSNPSGKGTSHRCEMPLITWTFAFALYITWDGWSETWSRWLSVKVSRPKICLSHNVSSPTKRKWKQICKHVQWGLVPQLYVERPTASHACSMSIQVAELHSLFHTISQHGILFQYWWCVPEVAHSAFYYLTSETNTHMLVRHQKTMRTWARPQTTCKAYG